MRLALAALLATSLAAGASACAGEAPAPSGSGDLGPDAASPDAGSDASLPDAPDSAAPAGALAQHCQDKVGGPSVTQVAPGVWVARGYDLANTILVQTAAGNVVIDVSMSPGRARLVKAALDAVAPGPVAAIIYTHSHIDHVGGASAWLEDAGDASVQIWATDAFFPHLVKQYGAFRRAEQRRGDLQFGQDLSAAELPCSAIGPRADVTAALQTGARKPTHTFSGQHTLVIGGVTLELVEAHGETHDQLFVWLPASEVLLPGDNFYAAFPNLYTIRGTAPRPIDQWIQSLDAMRAKDPAVLVPSHTGPVIGREAVRAALRDYRDAIQWVRDAVVRGANEGLDMDTLATTIALPAHLAQSPNLQPLYGQVDWSARAIYTNNLGWYDGRVERLYPPDDLAAREVGAMGGASAVLASAVAARESGDLRWSAHLLGKLRDAGALEPAVLEPELAATFRALGLGIENANGRAALLQTAWLLDHEPAEPAPVTLDPELVDALPVDVVFEVMPSRLIVETALGVHETLEIVMTDTGQSVFLTVRDGVAEVVTGAPLPGTPSPIAVLTTDTQTYKRLALQLLDPLQAVADGTVASDDLLAVLDFLKHFEQGI
ncbi:MAG: MBL fold metallo-hydrolase [Deltaproteobacteria bacterium]|nr:MBL fold metallo-hydrolase [Deltaproteobacteria bacterium]